MMGAQTSLRVVFLCWVFFGCGRSTLGRISYHKIESSSSQTLKNNLTRPSLSVLWTPVKWFTDTTIYRPEWICIKLSLSSLQKDERLGQSSWDLNFWFKESKYFKSNVSSTLPAPPAILFFLLYFFLDFNVFPRNGHRKYLITKVRSHGLKQSHKEYCSLSKVISASDYPWLHSLGSAFH